MQPRQRGCHAAQQRQPVMIADHQTGTADIAVRVEQEGSIGELLPDALGSRAETEVELAGHLAHEEPADRALILGDHRWPGGVLLEPLTLFGRQLPGQPTIFSSTAASICAATSGE